MSEHAWQRRAYAIGARHFRDGRKRDQNFYRVAAERKGATVDRKGVHRPRAMKPRRFVRGDGKHASAAPRASRLRFHGGGNYGIAQAEWWDMGWRAAEARAKAAS